jgi:spore cortex formation protein SpoVR/YcgB (stage V sporulation)
VSTKSEFDFYDFYRVIEDAAYEVISPEEMRQKLIAIGVPRTTAHWLMHKAEAYRKQGIAA